MKMNFKKCILGLSVCSLGLCLYPSINTNAQESRNVDDFISSFNDMTDEIQEEQDTTVSKLDKDDLEKNVFSLPDGVEITLNYSNDDIDSDEEIDDVLLSIDNLNDLSTYQSTGIMYCMTGGLFGTDLDETGDILTAALEDMEDTTYYSNVYDGYKYVFCKVDNKFSFSVSKDDD